MRIGELARRLALSPETLRFYERERLLPPASRRPSGYRDYDAEAAERLRLLAALRQLDVPLPDAAALATRCAAGRCEEVSAALLMTIPERRVEITRRIEELRHLDGRLALLAARLEAGQTPGAAIVLESEATDV